MPVLQSDNATTLPYFLISNIYISGGKKNKLNKIDIVGHFSKGKLEKGDLELIGSERFYFIYRRLERLKESF
jgi:hypothetical protein